MCDQQRLCRTPWTRSSEYSEGVTLLASIGQFASWLTGLGQAQAAAPVQTAVAPTLVPAQSAYAPNYAPIVAQNGYTQVAPTVGFRALALGWNTNGTWVVRTFPTLAGASVDALRTCNDQFGGCVLSDAVVAPTAFGCLAVVQGTDDTSGA